MSTRIAITTPLTEMEEQATSLPTQHRVCSLCCDEISASNELVILAACDHQGCRTCMIKWIETQEASGQANSPTCPFCRLSIHDDEVLAVLGSSFRQREALGEPDYEEIDELTLQWLNDQTTLCPGCGSRVEKLNGCDHMTCLCGCEFCYICGNVQCICNGGIITYMAEVDPIRDNGGIVDIRSCINRRVVGHERAMRGRDTRIEEENRWIDIDLDRHIHRHYELAFTFTCDGKWIFSCRKNSSSIMMLMQQYNSLSKRYERKQEIKYSIQMDPSWLFDNDGQDSECRALHLLLCDDVNCHICHGTEEERLCQNLENVELLFPDQGGT